MNSSKYQAIVKTVDTFPSLPTTVTRVLEVVNNPESSAKDLMEAVAPDQAMCATILKIANSAFFGRPREVSSLETAVMVLGFNEIQSIILGRTLFNTFKSLSRKHKEVEQFWQHAFYCGLSCKIIAEQLHLSQGELFISGLIHDIGKLALLITFPNDYHPNIWLQNLRPDSLLEKEKTTFSISHDEVGEKLLTRWFFPEKLVATVGLHHSSSIQTSEFAKSILIAQLSDIFAHNFTENNEFDTKELLTSIKNQAPHLQEMWTAHELDWSEEIITAYYAKLESYAQENSSILTILSS